jgi:hypothetical protein
MRDPDLLSATEKERPSGVVRGADEVITRRR